MFVLHLAGAQWAGRFDMLDRIQLDDHLWSRLLWIDKSLERKRRLPSLQRLPHRLGAKKREELFENLEVFCKIALNN
jgi:hypothetical protein